MSLSTEPDSNHSPDEGLARTVPFGLEPVVLKFYETAIKELRGRVADYLNAVLDPGDTKRPAVITDTGVRLTVGRITRSNPGPGVQVYDRKAFTEWVQATYPDEIEITVTVRPAFEKCFKLDSFSEHVVGPNDEVDPPGTRVAQRAPSVSVTADVAAFRQLWETGQTTQIQAAIAGAVASLFEEAS